jgi:hypothetical protein
MKGKKIPQYLSMKVVYSSHTYEVTTDDAEGRREAAVVGRGMYLYHACLSNIPCEI